MDIRAPASAAVHVVDNLSVYSNTRADSPQSVLRQNAVRFGLPASLENLVLVKVRESLTGKHTTYRQMLRGLPVERAEIIVSIGHNGQLLKVFNETKHIAASVDADAVNQLYNRAQITEEQALERGWIDMKVQHKLVSLPKDGLVWVAVKNAQPRPARCSNAAAPSPPPRPRASRRPPARRCKRPPWPRWRRASTVRAWCSTLIPAKS